MAKLLFKLNQVPDDEADAVRRLLDDHRIDYHETPGGFFGLAVAGFWLKDERQEDVARQLIEDYQQARLAAARAEYAEQRRQGTHDTLWTQFLRRPVQFIAYLGAAALVLYLTLFPFFL